MYPTSKGSTDARAAFITQVVDALEAAGAPDLPVWDTELNYGLAGPGPKYPRQTIDGLRSVTGPAFGPHLPVVDEQVVEEIIHRPTLELLGITPPS